MFHLRLSVQIKLLPGNLIKDIKRHRIVRKVLQSHVSKANVAHFGFSKKEAVLWLWHYEGCPLQTGLRLNQSWRLKRNISNKLLTV